MKYTVIGEILGLSAVVILTYLFMNSREMKLVDMMKMVGILYLPQRIALYLQCKYLMAGVIKKIEDENSG